MKKCVCVLLLLALVLSGCHGSVERSAFVVPSRFDESQQIELVFWAKNDTNLTQVQIYEEAIRDFEALYPNITIKLQLYTDYGRIYNDVITNIATDTTPNVCITYPDHIATYLTGQECVVALDRLFDNPQYGFGGSALRFDGPDREEMIDKFLEECKIGNTYYAIPYMRSTEACYVNRDFVEKLGYTLPEVLTWDFIWEVSKAAMEKDADGNFKVNGQKVMIPFIYKSTDNMMISYLKQAGAGYSTAQGDIELFNDTTKELLLAVADSSSHKAFNTFRSVGYPANYLNAGQCIFAIDSTAGATWMGSEAPLLDIAEDKLVQFETVVLPIPQLDTEHPQMISQGPSMCIFNKEDPQVVLASWLFAQFMLTDKVQMAYAQTEGYVPVTEKARNNPQYQDYLSRSGEDTKLYYHIKLDATRLLLENTDKTFVTPVFNGSASLRDAAGQLIEETKKAARRGETIDENYMQTLFSEMTSLHRLDQLGSSQMQNGQAGKMVWDKLPGEAIALLVTLGGVWVCIGVYFLFSLKKKAKKR